MEYHMTKTVDMSYDTAIEKVIEELKKVGFGILTTIDVKSTLKNKLDIDFQNYIILGACNPNLAHTALQSEIEIGLLLPCNVIVYDENDKTVVSFLNPEMMVSMAENSEALTEVSSKAKELMTEAFDKI